MAGVMRKAAGQTVTEGWSGWLSRPFVAAGWSAADLMWAIDYPPGDHGQHRLSAAVRHPVGWLRWRLGLWLGADGAALPSVSQVRAVLRERDRAERERHRAMLASRAAQIRAALGPAETASDPGPEQEPADAAAQAARIRDQLGWRKQ
jgi:hypothetical protein